MRGLIFIPDISGFTSFVKSIDMEQGVIITQELLNAIIDNNILDLQLSEIEGDALLFYKVGKPLPIAEIFSGFQKMYDSFMDKYSALKDRFGFEQELSLKLIVHYGDINVYDIRGFRVLYGQTVIESHRLLKNDSDTSDYILITDDYFSALNHSIAEMLSTNWVNTSYSSQCITGLRQVGYHFFNYVPEEESKKLYSYEGGKKETDLKVA